MRFYLVLGLLLYACGVVAGGRINAEGAYASVVKDILLKPLWEASTAYNAGHYLMVPLHATFALNDTDLESAFSAHYKRMLSRKSDIVGQDALSALTRLQYLYTASRYVVLAQENAVPGIKEFLLEELNRYWKLKPAWQWGRKPFEGGFRERLEWKLNTPDVKYSYYRAIIDEEMFLFSIAADLTQHHRQLNLQIPHLLKDILDVAYKTFKQEGVFEDDRWLFQPGVWTDHPDYAHVGHVKAAKGLGKMPITNIAMDVSHSHRFPLILLSMQDAELSGSERYSFYLRLRQGLAEQFFDVVLVPPSHVIPFYRTSNFMDGRNGVYRYQYGKMEAGKGYNAYALSGTLLLGWWGFLPSDRTEFLYQNLLENNCVMLRWVAENDPYGKNAWMYQLGYMEMLPFLPRLAVVVSKRL